MKITVCLIGIIALTSQAFAEQPLPKTFPAIPHPTAQAVEKKEKKEEPTRSTQQTEQKPSVPPTSTQPVSPKPPQITQGGGSFSFNFDDADVYAVVQTVFGDVLKVNYVVDPNIKGRVTFKSVSPIPRAKVLQVTETILRINGIAVVEDQELYKIVPLADAAREPSRVENNSEAGDVYSGGKTSIQVIHIKNMPSSEMSRILTPFTSKGSLLQDVPQSNHLIIADTDANIKKLLSMVEIFDTDKAKPDVFMHPVQNLKAKDIANILQQIFSNKAPVPIKNTTAANNPPRGQTTVAQQPQPSSQAASLENLSVTAKVFADEATNSVVVYGTPDDDTLISAAIRKLDIAPRQVVIEGMIARVTLEDDLALGFSHYLSAQAGNNRGDFKANAEGLDLTKLPTKGFTFAGIDAINQVRHTVTALATESKAEILAEPLITVSDNKEARIQVGAQVPVATTTTTNASTTPAQVTSTIQYRDIGIILKVKPQVNDSGLVTMEVTQEVSSLGPTVSLSIGTSDITIEKTEATSTLVARDGQTIAIGGLIRQDTTDELTGIPLLSKIPIIGNLFGTTTKKKHRTELIILLTPRVIKTEAQADTATKRHLERLKSTGNIKPEFLNLPSNGKEQPKAGSK